MADVAMPRLSDSMEEGTILKWLKSDGDEVSKGEELVEIETDKANMTYEADESGTLEIVAQEGDTLPVGETICRIGEGGGGSSDEDEDDDESADEDDSGEEDSDGEDDGSHDEDADGEDSGEDDDESAEEEESDDEDDSGEADEDADGDDSGGGDDEDADGDDSGGGDDEDADGDDSGGGDEGSDSDEDAPSEDSDDDEKDESKSEGGGERVKASPIARRMAKEAGVDLASIEGSGPGGRIVKSDVEAAAGGDKPAEDKQEEPAEAPKKKDGRGEISYQELSRLQRTVARRMAESKATAPDFVMTVEVDMEEAVALRAQLKAVAGDQPAPSFNDFVVKACALALREFPRANGAYRDGQFELYDRVNVGVAVAGQDALVVPTVFDADQKSLGVIATESRKLAERVREGKITPPELSGGTFTVSNLGMYGIRRFVAVINPPQAGILAVGELTPRAVVRDGEVVARAVMELTLTGDHRILYGADAAEFLGAVRGYLETPLRLVL